MLNLYKWNVGYIFFLSWNKMSKLTWFVIKKVNNVQQTKLYEIQKVLNVFYVKYSELENI